MNVGPAGTQSKRVKQIMPGHYGALLCQRFESSCVTRIFGQPSTPTVLNQSFVAELNGLYMQS